MYTDIKRFRFVSAVLAVLLLVAAVAGCSARSGNSSVVVSPVKAKEATPPAYGEEDTAAATAAAGANRFAFQLSAALLAEREQENFVCSPYSVWLPLAAEGIAADDINRAASHMLYDLSKGREYGGQPHNPLKIANAIFVGKDAKLNEAFAQVFSDCYQGRAINVDFSDPSAVEAVNRWAGEHTEGLIGEIVQEFDVNTVAAIANAIYFSDRWDWEFAPEDTVEDVFYAESGAIALKEALQALGVPLFDEGAAVLTGGLVEGDSPVWLSDAVQKAVIQVDENGTTAAAVTVMAAEESSAEQPPTLSFEMVCNRPFVFILCDYTYHGGQQVLFTGVVNRPE